MCQWHIGGEWQVLIYSQASAAAWPMGLPWEGEDQVNGNKKGVSSGGARALGLRGGDSVGLSYRGEGRTCCTPQVCGGLSDATW